MASTKPVFSLPLRGGAENPHAAKIDLDAEVNRVVDRLWPLAPDGPAAVLDEVNAARDESAGYASDAGLRAAQAALYDGPRRITVQQLMADEVLTYAPDQASTVVPGASVRADFGSHAYEVVAVDAATFDLETAGGVRLLVKQTESGDFDVRAFGAVAGAGDNTLPIHKAMSAARRSSTNVQYTDGGSPLAFVNTVPSVLFPSGEFRVSEAFDATGLVYISLKSLGKSFIQGSRDLPERSVTFLTAGSPSANGNLRYLDVDGIQFQNFDTLISANTSNLDMSRWTFKRCQFDAINLILDSHTYARSRSTICLFDNCVFQYRVNQIARVFFDKLNFRDCWIGWGAGSGNMIVANSLVKLDGCMLVPSGSSSVGKSLVYLTDDDGTGNVSANEAMRGVYINGTRASNEGGQGPLVVNDYGVQNVDNAISPVIHIDTCAITGVLPTKYDLGDSEGGLVYLKKWPAAVKYSGCSFRSLGDENSALVAKAASLTSEAPHSFQIELDATTYCNAQRAVGEGTTRRIARSLRGYINNPAPHNLRGDMMWEDGHIPMVDTATAGRKKATFFLRSGFVSGLSRMTPLVFDLYLGGQGITNATDSNLYAGASAYRLSVVGVNVAGNLLRIKVEKLNGDTWGAANASNCDIVSAHWGAEDTGSATTSTIAGGEISIVFGVNVLLGRARLVPAMGKLNRYGVSLSG